MYYWYLFLAMLLFAGMYITIFVGMYITIFAIPWSIIQLWIINKIKEWFRGGDD